MALKQSRRSISYNAAVYDAISQAARSAGLSQAEFVTRKLREAGVEIPETTHVSRAAAFVAYANKRQKARDRANGWVR